MAGLRRINYSSSDLSPWTNSDDYIGEIHKRGEEMPKELTLGKIKRLLLYPGNIKKIRWACVTNPGQR